MQKVSPQIWQIILGEFSDLKDAEQLTQAMVRLALAALLGAVLGYEREKRGRDAGLRTHILVSLGTAIIVVVPLQSGMELSDFSRVLQGIVAGVGFLGAGAIIKMDKYEEIRGLTTAASIWIAAAIGIAAGMGRGATAVISTLAALFVLAVLGRVERHIQVDRRRDEKSAPPPVRKQGEPVD